MSPTPIDTPLAAAPTPADASASGSPVGEQSVGGLWRQAVTPGLVLAAVTTGAVVASGRLPEGTGGWVIGGAAGAAITGSFGVWLKCRVIAAPPDPRGLGPSFQVALFGDFVLQLLTVGLALIAMFTAGVKFAHLAGLALAFASVALFHQLLSALVLARALRLRAASSARNTEVDQSHSQGTSPTVESRS